MSKKNASNVKRYAAKLSQKALNEFDKILREVAESQVFTVYTKSFDCFVTFHAAMRKSMTFNDLVTLINTKSVHSTDTNSDKSLHNKSLNVRNEFYSFYIEQVRRDSQFANSLMLFDVECRMSENNAKAYLRTFTMKRQILDALKKKSNAKYVKIITKRTLKRSAK